VSADGPATAVIVLHWGVEADTLVCLRSVVATGFPARPLLLVDNGTGFPSDAALAARGRRLVYGRPPTRLPRALRTGGARPASGRREHGRLRRWHRSPPSLLRGYWDGLRGRPVPYEVPGLH
jgi:hypothetical protein